MPRVVEAEVRDLVEQRARLARDRGRRARLLPSPARFLRAVGRKRAAGPYPQERAEADQPGRRQQRGKQRPPRLSVVPAVAADLEQGDDRESGDDRRRHRSDRRREPGQDPGRQPATPLDREDRACQQRQQQSLCVDHREDDRVRGTGRRTGCARRAAASPHQRWARRPSNTVAIAPVTSAVITPARM